MFYDMFDDLDAVLKSGLIVDYELDELNEIEFGCTISDDNVELSDSESERINHVCYDDGDYHCVRSVLLQVAKDCMARTKCSSIKANELVHLCWADCVDVRGDFLVD